MGFKCPICMKDFGRDKELWTEHCKKQHLGVAKDVVKAIKEIAGDKNQKKIEK